MSELVWWQDRLQLWQLSQANPKASPKELAAILGRSLAWVYEWRGRLAEAPPHDDTAVNGCSRARHNPPPRLHPEVIERILVLRDGPYPAVIGVPGPKRILKWLQQDKKLLATGHRLPRSTRTIWLILRQHNRIPQPPPPPIYPKIHWPAVHPGPSAMAQLPTQRPFPLPLNTQPPSLPPTSQPVSISLLSDTSSNAQHRCIAGVACVAPHNNQHRPDVSTSAATTPLNRPTH